MPNLRRPAFEETADDDRHSVNSIDLSEFRDDPVLMKIMRKKQMVRKNKKKHERNGEKSKYAAYWEEDNDNDKGKQSNRMSEEEYQNRRRKDFTYNKDTDNNNARHVMDEAYNRSNNPDNEALSAARGRMTFGRKATDLKSFHARKREQEAAYGGRNGLDY